MAPLILDFIGEEINLFFAFLIGLGFGFILEQAGFSSTRKLAGLFYGNDFTVLRVFFTAALTAMAGIIILGYTGFLNLDFIYINPLFVKSALIGGAIMGAGFILGGFCPGTSVCAASIGKIDAMAFIVGLMIGIVLFVEGFPLFESLYNADPLGASLVHEVLGMSRGLFAFLIIIAALATFTITGMIEKKVNGQKLNTMKRKLAATLVPVILVSFLLIFLPDKKSHALSVISQDNWTPDLENFETIDSDKLAMLITGDVDGLRVIDTRSKEAYKEKHVATSINIPFKQLVDYSWHDILNDEEANIVIISEDAMNEMKAVTLLKELNYTASYFVLEGGFHQFNEIYFSDFSTASSDKISAIRKNTADKLAILLKNENKAPVKTETIKVSGGC